ncbi:MAG: hypothetical protein JWM86_1034 [Thermoleophilia bacterium]|nr:hypothetical protein [Thermoleophilia bacterium]
MLAPARTSEPDMTTTPATVDAYAAELTAWGEELAALRRLLLELGLTESIKWRKPCYSAEGANIAIFQPFKAMCALMFFKGALLDDAPALLREQGEATQSALRLEFSSLEDVQAAAPHLPAYVRQSIAHAREGIEVRKKTTAEYPYPDELLARFEEDPVFGRAFNALTPGRQRGYLLHFAQAKQSSTRVARIERHEDRILEGLGMHD